MIKKRGALRRRLITLRTIQAIYMPCVASLLSQHLRTHGEPGQRTLDETGAFPEDQPLFFPYEIDVDELERCHPGLAELEERLRNAQMHDTLDKIRVQLHVKTRLIAFKNRNLRHQKQNTRARRQIEVNEGKIIALAEKYRAARRAKLALCGHGTWEREWRELARSDVRTLSSAEDPQWVLGNPGDANDDVPMLSEGRRQVSWIWMAADREDGDNIQDNIQDGKFPRSPHATVY